MALQKVVRNMLSTGVSDSSDATAITIDSNEKVGIGTTSPSTLLHLGGTAPGDSIIRQDSTSSGTNWEIGERTAGKWEIFEDDSDSIVATFMSSGNVGIGTTSPNAKLDVLGATSDQLRLRTAESEEYKIGRNSTTGLLDFHGTQSGYTGYTFGGVDGERMRITADGNLGLGDSSPANFSGYVVASLADSTGGIIDFKTTGSEGVFGRIQAVVNNQLAITNKQNYPLTFGTNDTTRLTILGNGNVGVGHTSPSSTFHVAGAKSYVSGTLQNMLQVEDTSSATTGVGGGIQFLGAYTGTTVTTGGSIEVKKANATGNDYAFNLVIKTRDNGSGNVERARFGSDGGSPTYGRLTLSSSYGSVEYGAANSSYHHFIVDSGPSKFYFSHRCEAAGGFHTYSDENLKKDITPITGALDDVAKMNGVTFKWKDAVKRGSGDNGKQFGVTAQNMLTVDSELPTINKDPLYNIKDDVKSDDEYYTMDYSRLTPYFIEAIKELKTKLEAAEAKIEALEG